MLYHVSEDLDITVFAPRLSPAVPTAVVWAIDRDHLRNYLLPRDCPRVTFSATPRTTAADRARFLSTHAAVVAIERAWLERAQHTPLACYHFSPTSFAVLDAGAGYYISRETVHPVRVEVIVDPLARLRELEVELRVLPDLWTLHDAVAASTMEFSMIRMALAARPSGQ
jgi:hypothetical protein